MIYILKIMYFSVILLVFISSACSQICNKRENTVKWNTVTYYRTYRETYKGNCFFRCTKTRLRSFIDQRTIPMVVTEDRQVCCTGYMVDESASSLRCIPLCIPSCNNGYCVSPGKCFCNDGYELQSNGCVPICTSACSHGTCVRPNECECDFGYTLVNNTCEAICTEPCVTGTCVAPDTCECFVGYRKNYYNFCLPYCSTGCPHGVCVNPETCSCNDGWYKNETDTQNCVPRCDIDCGGGSCVSPNVCECYPGYQKSEIGTCLPNCFNCLHGTCIGPENCTCDEGWYKNETGCMPVCDFDCGGGECTEPNTCKCFPGYVNSENGSCVPHCSNCSNGLCVSPEVCQCNEGFFNNGSSCQPYCNINCGNGTCVAPDTCECYPGYQINSEGDKPLCAPECENCKGYCVAPYECITPDVIATTLSCDCNESFFDDDCDLACNSATDSSEIIRELSTSSEMLEQSTFDDYDGTIVDSHTKDALFKNDNVWLSYSPHIAATIGTLLLMILLSILFIKRKEVARICHGGSYSVKEEKEMDTCNSVQMDVSYSSIMKKQRE